MATAFQKKVFDAARKIPRGKVSTYKLVAGHIGCGSARAVGQALKRNPYAPLVPCHRVIASDLTIGGYKGRARGAAAREKISLLKKENVGFVGGELADRRRLYEFRSSPCEGS